MLIEWFHVFEHATALALVAALIWLSGRSVLLGRGVFTGGVRSFELKDLGETQALAGWVVGWAVWTGALFFLAMVGLLNGWAMALVLAVLIALLVVGTRRQRRHRGERTEESGAEEEKFQLRPSVLLGIFLLAGLLLPFFLIALSPIVSTDAAVYHLTVPKLYLEAGGFRTIEMNVYSNWPLGVEMLFSLALALKGAVSGFVLAKLVHFLFGVLVLYGLHVACRQTRLEGSVAWIAMVLFLANDVTGFELRVAHVELAQAFFLLSSFVFLLRALEAGFASPSGRKALLFAGIAAGLLAGSKITGIVDAAILGLLCVPAWFGAMRRGEGRAVTGALATCFLLPVALFWLPWILKSWWMTGNPVYPLLYGVFGGPDWSPVLTEQFTSWQRSIGMGREPRDYLLLPLRVLLLGGRGYDNFDGELSIFWLVLVPFAAIFGIRRPPARRALTVALLHFLFWSVGSQQIRFLVPILPLLAFAVAVPLSEILGHIPRGRRLVGLVLLAFTLVPFFRVHGELIRRVPLQVAALRHAPPDLELRTVPEIFRRIDEELPEDARLLFLGTNQGYFSEREFLADSFFEASQIVDWLRSAATPEELRTLLRSRGITHLLLDRRPLGVPYPQTLQQTLQDPSVARILWTAEEGRYVVFELDFLIDQ